VQRLLIHAAALRKGEAPKSYTPCSFATGYSYAGGARPANAVSLEEPPKNTFGVKLLALGDAIGADAPPPADAADAADDNMTPRTRRLTLRGTVARGFQALEHKAPETLGELESSLEAAFESKLDAKLPETLGQLERVLEAKFESKLDAISSQISAQQAQIASMCEMILTREAPPAAPPVAPPAAAPPAAPTAPTASAAVAPVAPASAAPTSTAPTCSAPAPAASLPSTSTRSSASAPPSAGRKPVLGKPAATSAAAAAATRTPTVRL
jgi:hypothetical protein